MRTGRRKALAALAVLAAAAAAGSGCCGTGPLRAVPATGPVADRPLDAAHARLAATGGGVLYAGAAAVDITSDWGRRGELLLGGFDMGRKNRGGVNDPVFARALYLDDGVTPLVLVTLDVIGYLNDDVLSAREAVTDLHRGQVIIASTHDHVGPDVTGFWGCGVADVLPVCSGRIPGYMAFVRNAIAEAVAKAVRAARPVRVKTGRAMMDPALCSNIHDEIEQQKDDSLRVLSFEGEDGTAVATVANWGCHAETLWNADVLSADFPGVFYRLWEREVGGVAMFVEGAQGGLIAPNPYANRPGEPVNHEFSPGDFPVAERLKLMEHLGTALHRTARAALQSPLAVEGPAGVRLGVASAVVDLPLQNWIFQYVGNRGLIPRTVAPRGHDTWLRTDVTAARISAAGRPLADLVTVPGEPAPPFLAEVDATSDAPLAVNVAIANDAVGYIVREADWNLPYYDYERSMSLGRTTGTRLLEAIGALREAVRQPPP